MQYLCFLCFPSTSCIYTGNLLPSVPERLVILVSVLAAPPVLSCKLIILCLSFASSFMTCLTGFELITCVPVAWLERDYEFPPCFGQLLRVQSISTWKFLSLHLWFKAYIDHFFQAGSLQASCNSNYLHWVCAHWKFWYMSTWMFLVFLVCKISWITAQFNKKHLKYFFLVESNWKNTECRPFLITNNQWVCPFSDISVLW